MRKELELKLVEKYPTLFRDYGGDMTKTCMAWGCECGDGWFDILSIMCEKLSRYNDVVFVQVKEKFGTLRVYINAVNVAYADKVREIIDEAEIASANTCELCGASGKLSCRQGWWSTVCNNCENKKDLTNQN